MAPPGIRCVRRVLSSCLHSAPAPSLRSWGHAIHWTLATPRGEGSGRCSHAVGPMSMRTPRGQSVSHDRTHHEFCEQPAPGQLRREGGWPRRRRRRRATSARMRSSDRCGLPPPRRSAFDVAASHRGGGVTRHRTSRTERNAGERTRRASTHVEPSSSRASAAPTSSRASAATRGIRTSPLIRAPLERDVRGVHQGPMENARGRSYPGAVPVRRQPTSNTPDPREGVRRPLP